MLKESGRAWGWNTLWLVMGLLTIILLTAISGGFNRFASVFREETRTQTYESSRAFRQGTMIDLADLCRQRALATDSTIKAGIEDVIRLRAARVTFELPYTTQRCIDEVS